MEYAFGPYFGGPQPAGMRVVTTVPPAVEPVSLDEAKQWGNISNPDDDGEVTLLIQSCREAVEDFLGQSLITQTRTLYLSGFPLGWTGLTLPYPPLQSIASILYTGQDGTQATFSPSSYKFTANSTPGRVWLPFGSVWPFTFAINDAVAIAYVCGYGDTADAVPARARLMMRSLITSYYENRGSHQLMQGGSIQATALFELLGQTLDHGRYG